MVKNEMDNEVTLKRILILYKIPKNWKVKYGNKNQE